MDDKDQTYEQEQSHRRAGFIALLAGMMMSGAGAALSSVSGWPGLVMALGGAVLCVTAGIRLVRRRP
jgi:hypothetical protein